MSGIATATSFGHLLRVFQRKLMEVKTEFAKVKSLLNCIGVCEGLKEIHYVRRDSPMLWNNPPLSFASFCQPTQCLALITTNNKYLLCFCCVHRESSCLICCFCKQFKSKDRLNYIFICFEYPHHT